MFTQYKQMIQQCGYLCISFIDFMLKGKILLDSTNLFSPNKIQKSDKIILIFNNSKLKNLFYQ